MGFGAAIEIQNSIRGDCLHLARAITLGERTEQNPYTGELAAIADTLRSLPKLRYRNILLVTRNKAAALTLGKSRQQSGQRHIGEAYNAISSLRREGNNIVIAWLPAHEEDELMDRAKKDADTTTRLGAEPGTKMPGAKLTTLNLAWAKRSAPPTTRSARPARVPQLAEKPDPPKGERKMEAAVGSRRTE